MNNVVQRSDTGRLFPTAIESEKAVFGILLFRPDCMRLAIDRDLQPGHFMAPHHEAIYQALLALHHDGQTIQFEAVEARMAALGTAQRLVAHDGAVYLINLNNACGNADGLADHIAAVKLSTVERRQAWIREELHRDLSPERRQALGQELSALGVERDSLLSFADGWPGEAGPPLPLDDLRPPPWPDDVLPSPLSEYVDAVSDSIQVPRDLAGMLALGALSACWAGKVRAIQPVTGHAEELCLYVVAAADVGERKSSTYARFETPIRTYELERRQALEPLRSAYRADYEGLDAEFKSAISRRKGNPAASMDNLDARDTARRLRQELDALRPPPRPDFLTQDCTPEGLARLMSETGGFACLMNPEGGGIFDILAGRYSEVPNLDVFLKSYDGERLVIHRANKDREVPPIERPSLAFVVATQPATLRRLASRQELDERGLVARMLFAIPADSRVGYRQAFKPAIPETLAQSYDDLILWALRIERPEQPHAVAFSQEAAAEYAALFDNIEPRLRPDGDLHPMRGWACKLVGKIVRIAALLHLMDCRRESAPWTISLSGEAFRRAARLTEYLIEHARRALCLMRQSPQVDGARKLLAVLARDNKARFTTRDAQRIIAHNGHKDEVRPVLDLLCLHNFIARSTPRRADSEAWIVNPRHVQTWKLPRSGSPSSIPGTVGTLS
jgi:replicative DNA helicase